VLKAGTRPEPGAGEDVGIIGDDIEIVAAKQADSPEFGPQHPYTLESRSLLAGVLDTLSRSAEAPPIIEDVAARQVASPERADRQELVR
jgi:hypothetical protein